MDMKVISRVEAHRLGRTMFFTGKPCRKQGHLAQRYVSSGGCKACVNGMFKKSLGSGLTHDLINFRPQKLMIHAGATREEAIRVRHYLQNCIFAFFKANRPDLQTPSIDMASAWYSGRGADENNPAEIP